jgi:hypothetical protein
MRVVEDTDGTELVVRKASADAFLVVDPQTGSERYVDRDDVTVREGASALETAASGVPPATRRVLTAVPDDIALGLLLELVDQGPIAARDLLSAYDLCESDLQGRLAELRAAGLATAVTVADERGYEATDLARTAARELREPPLDSED